MEFVDYVDERFRIPVNSSGYYLLSNSVTEPGAPRRSALTRFRERPDFEAEVSRGAMPVFGLNRGNSGILGIVTGMELSFRIIVRLEKGFYQLTVRYNSYTDTVNTCIKADPALRLWNFEAGGRPLAYYFSAFTADNWMGNEDLRGLTPERIAREVGNLKVEYDQYRTISDLQTIPLFSHETLAENVVCMTYENGEKLIFNKNKTVFEYENKEIAPYSFVRIKSV